MCVSEFKEATRIFLTIVHIYILFKIQTGAHKNIKNRYVLERRKRVKRRTQKRPRNGFSLPLTLSLKNAYNVLMLRRQEIYGCTHKRLIARVRGKPKIKPTKILNLIS
jgi:hypothetical protein